MSEKIGDRMEKNGEDMTGMHHHVDRSDDVLVSTRSFVLSCYCAVVLVELVHYKESFG